MNERLMKLLAEAAKRKSETEGEDELPANSDSVLTPVPLRARSGKDDDNVGMLERMLRSGLGKGEENVEPFELLDEESILTASQRQGFYSRLLQDEEPVEYVDEEDEDEEEMDEASDGFEDGST